ncbi:hypothetical protein V1509DRAFT_638278 [Lipomyces kononenkoae]
MTTDASSQSELRALYTYKAAAATGTTLTTTSTHTITIPLANSNDGDRSTLDAVASQLQTFQAEINAYLTERIENSRDAEGDRDAIAKLERTVLDGEMDDDDDDDEEAKDD